MYGMVLSFALLAIILVHRVEELEQEIRSSTWRYSHVVFATEAPSGPCRMDKVLVITQSGGMFTCENQRIKFLEVAK